MNTLAAGTLRLEPLTVQHAPAMFDVLADLAIYEFENAPPESVEALQLRYALLASRRSPAGDEQWLNWAVRLPGGTLAGCMQATVLPGGAAYVAYELASRHWRQGIGSAALQAVLHELAAHYDVRDAFAVLKARNHRSLGLLHKLGFAPPPPQSPAPWRAEPDEIVLHKALR